MDDMTTMTGEVLEVGTGQVAQPKVSKGLQTWLGYGAAGLSAGIAAFADAAGGDLSDPVRIALVALAGFLLAVTGRNRSDQATALVRADAAVKVAAMTAPALPVVVDPNVELSDAMPSELHPPSLEGDPAK